MRLTLLDRFLRQEAEQSTGGHCRTDDACHIGAHGVHEEEVVAVVLQSHIMTDTGGHWHGGDSGIANEGVDLLVFGKEQIHNLNEQHAAGRGNGKGEGTDGKDEHGVEREELAGLSGAAHGETQQHHHNVVQRSTGSLGQSGGLTTLFQQIAKNSMPSKGRAEGTMKVVMSSPMMGKRMRSVWLT